MWCFPLMRKHARMYVNICANVSTCACGAKAVFLDMQTVLGCNWLLTHPPTLLEHTNSPCEIPVYCTYWLMLTHAVCIYKLWNLITSCKYIVFGSAARPTRLAHFSEGCRTHCACHAKLHPPQRKKCSETVSFLTLLTSKCASHHSDMRLFNSWTFKSAPRTVCLACWLRNDSKCASRHSGIHFFNINLQKCFEPAVTSKYCA